MMLLLLLLVQDPVLTPGVVRPMTATEICAVKWGKDHRHVTTAMKREVFRRYGIAWSARALYEVDHLIPRELGGADDILNLWPQVWSDAHIKDLRENSLHRSVCTDATSLEAAQNEMRQWGKQ